MVELKKDSLKNDTYVAANIKDSMEDTVIVMECIGGHLQLLPDLSL